jgi:hypothetical protein
VTIGWRGPVVYTHRWLGIVFGVLFILWFVSGIVMMYAGMPALEPQERLARLPRLDFSSARVSVSDAAMHGGGSAQRLRIGMFAERPVYRLFSAGRWTTVFADTGDPLDGLTAELALEEARRFAPEHASTIRYDSHLTEPDQWTIESRALLPMHRVALGDEAATHLYISEQTAEPLLKTTRTSRGLGYAGAVIHWIYFTPFRTNGALWAQFIIWGSVVGIVMCLTGLIWGVWQYVQSRSPYTGSMRWHHYTGLIFGLTTLTFMFSGLLSMDPWSWHPGTSPTPQQRDAVSGGPLRVEQATAEQLRMAVEALSHSSSSSSAADLKELELVQFRGEMFLRSDAALVAVAATERGPFVAFDRAAMLEAAKSAMPGVSAEDAVWLEEYDSYYYDRAGTLPLPVLRVRYNDPQRTWLYLDPRRGAIVRKEERLTRLNRWVYHGFHSWDFPFLYYRRPLWDLVVIVLSLGGLASAVTTLAPGWRRLRRHLRRLLV